MKIHPAARLLPNMSAGQYSELRADIEAHGLIEPIWICNGKILDGRNRERACRELGIEVVTRKYEGDNPEAFVVSANVTRRHLTAQQRRGLAKRLLAAHPEMSDRHVAATVHVGTRAVAALRSGDVLTSPDRVGRDGKRYPVRAPQLRPPADDGRPLAPNQIRMSSITNPKDLEFLRFFRFITALHPNELSDALAKIEQVEQQLNRLRALVGSVAASNQ